MEVWLDIRNSGINDDLVTIRERVSFQVTGTVTSLEQETIDVTSFGAKEPEVVPGEKRARVFVDSIGKVGA